jgi:hypothetical protein
MSRILSTKNPYYLTKHRFYEVYHYAMQYQEWKDEYRTTEQTMRGIAYDGVKVKSSGSGDTLGRVAIRLTELSEKIEMLEAVAKETDKDLSEYILRGVTDEQVTYNYLSMVLHIPCSRNTYYSLRRKFYWLLSERLGLRD